MSLQPVSISYFRLDTLLPEAAVGYTKDLWRTFHSMYLIIGATSYTEEDICRYEELAEKFHNLFTSVADVAGGASYGPSNVTPYIHILVRGVSLHS